MPETIAAPEQAQAAPESQNVEQPALSISEASEQLTLARITQASPEEIARLEALVNPPAPKATDEPAPVEAAGEAVVETLEAVIEPTAGELPQAEDVDDFKVSNRPRLTHLSEPDKHDMSLIVGFTRKGMSLAEATQRVMGDLNAPRTEAEVPVARVPVASISDLEAQTAACEAQLAELEVKLDESNEQLVDAKLSRAHGRAVVALADAKAELKTAKVEHRMRAEAQEQAYAVLDEQKQEVLHKTAEKWGPEVVTKGTDFYNEAESIAEDATANPRHALHQFVNHASFVTHCAELAAKRLGKHALSPNAAAAKAPIASAKPSPPQPGPASGSRASAPAAPAKSEQQTIEESEAALMAVLTGQSHSFPTKRQNGVIVVR